jgi:hypothetical protein
MSLKIRNAGGLACLLALITSMSVLAKGGFSFISITGPGIDEEIRATDLKLTEDFFTFADFYRDKVEAPKDPGMGYEISRYYIDGKREILFDRLHYYPSTGFVFYDGIVGGDSDYDGEWYSANPAVKIVFESAVGAVSANVQPVQQMENQQPAAGPVRDVQPSVSISQPQTSAPTFPSDVWMPVAILAGLLALAALALKLHKTVFNR